MKARAVSALKSLRSVKPFHSVWEELPFSRRAAVLVLLYKDHSGDLASVLTMRSEDLSSFSGHAALPGGKADDAHESPLQVARRETFEEIGFPADDATLASRGYSLEVLATLPAYLSRNLLAVRPTIAFLDREKAHPADYNLMADMPRIINVGESKEVGEVFSCQLHQFLLNTPGWYVGKPVNWGGLTWNQHWFKAIRKKKEVGEKGWLSVWGLTANILVDTARLAFDTEPAMNHRAKEQLGDEEIIRALADRGKLPEVIDKEADNNLRFNELFGDDSPLLRMRSV
jgi:coenzyme A diphosphatase NUDT7